MLDTNTVSSLIKENPIVSKRIASLPMDRLCLSVISEGELLYGLTPTADGDRRPLKGLFATTSVAFSYG
jgi:predicted nucleic acid-binding protein